MLGRLFSACLGVSLSTGVVILFLAAFRPLMERRYAARWFGALFLVLAVRLLIPFHPQAVAPPVSISAPAPAVIQAVPVTPLDPPAQAAAQMPALSGGKENAVSQMGTGRPITLEEWLALLWCAGMAGSLLYEEAAYIAFWRRIGRWGKPENHTEIQKLMHAQCKQLGMRKEIRLMRMEELNSPMAAGLLKPVILLPEQAYSPEDLALIFRHELIHIKRGDILLKLIFLLARSVHWFNPAVWLMEREGNRMLEFSCDDRAIKGLSAEERRRYCQIVLEAASSPPSPRRPTSTAFIGTKRALRARLSNIFSPYHKKTGVLAFCAVLVGALTVGSMVAFGSDAPLKLPEMKAGESILLYKSPSPGPEREQPPPPLEKEIESTLRRALAACDDVISPMPLDIQETYFPTDAEFEALTERLADTGYALMSTENYRSMQNYQKVESFCEALRQGKNAQVTILRPGNSEILSETFDYRDGILRQVLASGQFRRPQEIEMDPARRIEVMWMTDAGHLIYHIYGDEYYVNGDETDIRQDYRGYCVMPHDKALMELCEKYVDPLGLVPQGGALLVNWDAKDMSGLNWAVAFESAWRRENAARVWEAFPVEQTPEDDMDSSVILPAGVVEPLLMKYYPVTAPVLRKTSFYDPERGAYVWHNSDAWGTPPADWPEVSSCRQNADGTLTLAVRTVELSSATDRLCTSWLTLMPREDGSCRYLSNETNYRPLG